MHTKDALSAIVRLEDMGVEPYLVANSLVGVVAQRLMRKLCPECAREVDTDEAMRAYLGSGISKVRVPVGCAHCNYTGYSGRIAIHEIVYVDKTLRRMIASKADMEDMRRYALETQGMRSLGECGAKLVARGVTSMEELLKVAFYE